MANLTRRSFAAILAALVPATVVKAAIPALPARQGRTLREGQLWGGNLLVAYEVTADAFERWCPDGVEETRAQMARKYLKPDAYDKQRRPFEVVELYRGSNGRLSYHDLKVRTFETEAEALAHFEGEITRSREKGCHRGTAKEQG